MNKSLIKLAVAAWAVIAVVLSAVLILAISSGGETKVFNIFSLNGGELNVQKTEEASIDNCSKIKIDFPSDNIIISSADSDKITVVQKAQGNLNENEKFTVSKEGDVISIQRSSSLLRFHILWFGGHKSSIEVFLPKGYAKDLEAEIYSGNITFNSDLTLNNVTLRQTSGNLKINSTVNAGSASIKVTSGNMDIKNLKVNEYSITATSGNININSLSGSGKIEATSGNIKASYEDIKEYSNVKAVSGDIRLTVPKTMSFEFNGKCISGKINTSFEMNYKNKKGSEAAAVIGNAPYKKITAETTSGNIEISNE